jgi:hypothetical protein
MELQGWKQIADHLHVTERTAQNWVSRQRMPVHHLPGRKGRVFANAEDLDAWKRSGPTPVRAAVRKTITVRLSEDDLNRLRPLASGMSMQEFVSRAVLQYAEQLKSHAQR